MNAPYTGQQMSAEIGAGDAATERFDHLHAEAKEALARAANTLRAVTEQYREAFHEELAGWHGDRDALDQWTAWPRRVAANVPGSNGEAPAGAELRAGSPSRPRRSGSARRSWPAGAGRPRPGADVALPGARRRVPLATRRRRTWPPTSRCASSRPRGGAVAPGPGGSRRAGPGPRNAIFGVEYIEKILDRDRPAARMELRFLRERLRRELGEVRAFISQQRPPILDEMGLDGSIREAWTRSPP